jgi:hypothetical protein
MTALRALRSGIGAPRDGASRAMSSEMSFGEPAQLGESTQFVSSLKAGSRTHRRPWKSGVLGAALCTALMAAGPTAPAAHACGVNSQTPPPRDDAPLTEAEISTALQIGEPLVKRGNDFHCGRHLCLGYTGIVRIPLALPAASRQSICKLTLAVAITGGNAPGGLADLHPRAGVDCEDTRIGPVPALQLAFNDEDDTEPGFSFDLSIALVDSTGVTGPAAIVRIEHAGGSPCSESTFASSGCTIRRGQPPAGFPLAWALLAGVVVGVRRGVRFLS